MIQLQTDFSLLHNYFGISPNKILHQYVNKSIEEIMELEAQQGNQKAREYKKILSDPEKIFEIFKLSNVENRFIILQNMSENDVDDLLPFLDQKSLVNGLQFFSEEKLFQLCKQLPIEELCIMLSEKFSMMDILKLMPEDSMDKFLKEPDVERKYAQKYFESLSGAELKKIMAEQFGIEYSEKTKEENLEHLEKMEDSEYIIFLTSMKREQKMGLIDNIVDQEPDFMMLFEPVDLIAPMQRLMKQDNIKIMSTLDKEFLVPMIEELPVDLTQIVLTQIDPRVFSEILTEDFQDILSSVVLFSNKAA